MYFLRNTHIHNDDAMVEHDYNIEDVVCYIRINNVTEISALISGAPY